MIYEKELRVFQNKLSHVGLCIHSVPADGNCLFSAVSHQLYSTSEHHSALRKQAVDFMLDHSEDFKGFIPDLENYTARMSTLGIWGSHFEIQALSRALGVNFAIHRLNSPPTLIQNFEDSRWVHLSQHLGVTTK